MHPYVYFQKICTLKGKTLTLREIDVIACLLSGKSIKRITAILKIEQKTVETHWQNVKNKTGLFSKDALIHYVESSGQKLFFDAHYEILLKEDVFTHEINIQKPWSVKIFTSLKEPTSRYFSELIKRHLDKIGLKSKIFVSEYLPEGVIELKNCETNRKKMIVSNQKNNGGELNYYTSLLDALIKMDSHLSVDDEKVDILYKTLCTSSLPLKKHSHFFSHLLAYYHKHWLFMLISTLFLGSVFYINCINDSKKNNTISLDKHIQRKKLDEKITECIKKQKDIAYCVLFGVVGSGKTVQARSYAKYHAPSYHFEVDSRTLDSIKKSFLQIAYMLSQTIAEKEEVEFIKKISDTHIRQNELIRFVHHLLKKNPTWYLIFDNVVHYDDIEAFIPKKTLESESGNVIFTTYNGDVLQYFEKAQCVSVGELSEKEALDLFFRICNRFEKEDVEKFLKTIPHFPLDISISASYINVNNINLLEYIDRLSKNECHDVLKKRSTILNESFSILIKKNDVYRTIICYIAFFECNAISKKLLYVLFDHEIVDAFINELKRYAFIVSDMMREDDYFFSLHPGVHDFLLTYIKDQKYIDEFSKKIENDLLKLRIIFENKSETFKFYEKTTPHLESFLNKASMLSLLSKKTEFLFHQIIGYGHYFGSRLLEKSKNDFERVRLLDEKLKILSQKQKMELLRVLAILYTDLGDGDMAIKYADEGLLNCENNSFEKAELLSQKGYAQSLFNKFEESEAIFKEGLLILESLPKSNQNDFLKSIIYGQRAINIAQTLLCDDKDALSYIKEAFSSFDFDGQIRKGIPRQVCYHFATLGHIYCYRGEFEEAMSEGFLKAMSIIDNQWDGCPHHIIKLFTQGGIGECLLRFGKVTEAEKLLRDVVDRTYKLRGDQFPPVYKIQTLLLECYLKENKLDEAENELIQLLTYDVSKSPNYIRFFECYLHYLAAHLYVKKGDLNKSADHFLIFFQKMKMFLCCLKKESIDDIKIQRNRKNSLNEELDIFSKKSQELLNKIYPKIDFRV